jgi:hypothetical protein
VQRVSPWFRNELKRLIKTPKLHLRLYQNLLSFRDRSRPCRARC